MRICDDAPGLQASPMIIPGSWGRRTWVLLGALVIFLGSLGTYLAVNGRKVSAGPDAVEVALNDPSPDHQAVRLVLRRHSRGPVLLMNWALEEKGEQQWKRVAGKTFPGGQSLDRDRELSFSLPRPATAAVRRVRVQYGIGLYGARLWHERARLALRTGRWAAALHYNEWEAGESIAEFGQ